MNYNKHNFFMLCLIIASTALFRPAKAQNVTFAVHGHQDDWQLFMSSSILADMAAGNKLVFITLTAGDAGNGPTGGIGSIPYFLAREKGSVYASKFGQDLYLTGVNYPTPVPAKTEDIITYTTANGVTVSHVISKYSYKKVVNYFLRLPDGNTSGLGYPATGSVSLKIFKEGGVSTLTAIDNSTTYNGWADLVETIKTIILKESVGDPDGIAWLNTSSQDAIYNWEDHPDHKYASIAGRDAVASLPWIGINGWMFYNSIRQTANLDAPTHQNATAVFAMCQWAMMEYKYTPSFNDLHKRWLPMDYFRVDRVPSAPTQRVAQDPAAAQEIPMVVTYNNPVDSKSNTRITLSNFEKGIVTVEVYDMNGKIMVSDKFSVESDFQDIQVNTSELNPGTYVMKFSLNGKYTESKKLTVN